MTFTFPPIRDWYENKNDNFGFYDVGGLKVYSKIEAFELAKYTNSAVKWRFNEPVFSSFDWTIEPPQSLKELYRARAQQLRDRYDYIVLMLSGGADSTTTLQAFAQNGILLDEVVTTITYQGDKDPLSFWNVECTLAVNPILDKIKHLIPNTVITQLDLSEYMVQAAKNKLFDLPYDMNQVYNSPMVAFSMLRDFDVKWNKMSEAGKRVTFLWGHNKPMVKQVDGKFYFYTKDHMDFCVSPRSQRLNREHEYNELFFSSPDCVPLMIKQGHIVKRWLQNPIFSTDYLWPDLQSPFGNVKDAEGKHFGIRKAGIDRIVYPPDWWDETNTYTKGKQQAYIFSNINNWFLQLNTDESKFYRKQQLAVPSKLGELFISTHDGKGETTASLDSKGYLL